MKLTPTSGVDGVTDRRGSPGNIGNGGTGIASTQFYGEQVPRASGPPHIRGA